MVHIPFWTDIAADYITWEARRQGRGVEGAMEAGGSSQVGEPTDPLWQRIMSS